MRPLLSVQSSAHKSSLRTVRLKHIVYKYGGERPDEIAFDSHDLFHHAEGGIVERNGVEWKVDRVKKEDDIGLTRIPTYWVYLSPYECPRKESR
jgi:hypothetical protein